MPPAKKTTAKKTAAKKTAVERVPFSGLCEELLDKIRNDGVVTPDGQRHPRWPGVTRAELHFALNFTISYRPKQIEGFSCPDGQVFTDIMECTKRCRFTMGTVPCMPTTATVFPATFKPTLNFKTTTWRMDYTPPAGTPKAGLEAVKRWHDEIEKHERRHQTDVQARQNEFREKYAGKDVRYFTGVDGPTAEKAAQKWLDGEVKRVLAEWDRQVASDRDAFHKEPEGGELTPPDCRSF
jgi:hypothetical protein